MKSKRGVKAIWRKITMSVAAAILIGVIIAVCVICKSFDRILTGYFMSGTVGETIDRETLAASEKLSHDIVEEGVVLLKNENNALPLKTETKINVFGWGATDGGFVVGGSGSGDAAGGNRVFTRFLDALELSGFEYNEPLVKISTDFKGGREGESLNLSQRSTFFRLYEPTLTSAQIDQAKAFAPEVAIIVLSRLGGEGQDLPYYQYKSGSTDTSRTYLQLSEEEEDLIDKVTAAQFGKVIVILNTCNAMELDALNANDGIDAIMSAGAPGQHGAVGIANVLRGSKLAEKKDLNGDTVMTEAVDGDGNPVLDGEGNPVMVPDMERVDVSPSGKTVDIYPKSHSLDPVYINGAAGIGSDGGKGIVRYSNSSGDGKYYIDYTESIYYGYRYFETAAADGFFNYYDQVVYPFGYGKSYTEFEWRVVGNSPANNSTINADTKISMTVAVKNTGETAGKDVLQIYFTAPYTNGGIEKAHKVLAAFIKTDMLKPLEEKEYTLEFDAYQMASYDYNDANGNGFKGYELDSGSNGEYKVYLQSDSHETKGADSGGLAAVTYRVPDSGSAGRVVYDKDITITDPVYEMNPNYDPNDPDSDKTRVVPGKTAKKTLKYAQNVFTGEDAYDNISIDGEATAGHTGQGSDAGIQYLTRSQLGIVGTAAWKQAAARPISSKIDSASGINWVPVVPEASEDPVTGSGSPVFNQVEPGRDRILLTGTDDEGKLVFNDDIIMELGSDYREVDDNGDPTLWYYVLNQIPSDLAWKVISESGHQIPDMTTSIGKPAGGDFDGPSGLNMNNMFENVETSWSAFPTETVIGSTWNADLAFDYGLAVAKEGAESGIVTGWYAPAINLHRSAYAGRNFEYYSEDPFISGVMGAYTTRGALSGGMYCYIKHFAVNDCETARDYPGEGLRTWLTEQTLREIYLRPFEITVKTGGANGVMSAFNRIGATWAGASYGLLTTVLRDEWGFRGSVVTDFGQNYMHFRAGLAAGNDLWLAFGTGANMNAAAPIAELSALKGSAAMQWKAREAMHNMLWTYTNTAYANRTSIYDNVKPGTFEYGFPYWWFFMVLPISLALFAGAFVLVYFSYIHKFKRRNSSPVLSGAEKTDAEPVAAGGADSFTAQESPAVSQTPAAESLRGGVNEPEKMSAEPVRAAQETEDSEDLKEDTSVDVKAEAPSGVSAEAQSAETKAEEVKPDDAAPAAADKKPSGGAVKKPAGSGTATAKKPSGSAGAVKKPAGSGTSAKKPPAKKE